MPQTAGETRLRRVQPRAARCQAYSSFPLSFPEWSTLLQAQSPYSGTARARRRFPGSACLMESRHPVAPPRCAARGLRGLSPLSRSDAIKGWGYVSLLVRRSPLHCIPSPQSFTDRRAYALREQGDVPQSAGPTASNNREESPELGPGPVRPTAAAPLLQHRRFKFIPPQLSGGFRSCR
ncbi:hypothetical protein NDU88_006036 [Pleurodeles waltl]|uniref:Uncharacterized protein n=1 Tax=Pleurodeles waltl TaxID=8319 RepID=A0AAV7TCC8_PLEWA|nr:hypothetical protein NDU88_006036 [Pleurodeles waltl]